MIRATILIAIAVVFLGGCGGNKTVREQTTTVIDSTITETRIVPRDTIITAPADSVEIQIPIKELTNTPIEKTSKSGRTKSRVWVNNEVLNVECLTDSLEQVITLREKTISNLRKIISKKEEVIYVPEPYVPFWTKMFSIIGKIVSGILAGALLVLVGKLIIKKYKPF